MCRSAIRPVAAGLLPPSGSSLAAGLPLRSRRRPQVCRAIQAGDRPPVMERPQPPQPPDQERSPTALQTLLVTVLKLWDASPAPWHKLPAWTLLPVTYLSLRRVALRMNLLEVPQPPGTPIAERLKGESFIPDGRRPTVRTDDGWGNDGAAPDAGAFGATIGRNMRTVPPAQRFRPNDPAPQLVAQKLLARRTTDGSTGFRPAGMQLNVLAAAWIQIMIHDWQEHELREDERVTLAEGERHGCPLAKFQFKPTKNAARDGGTAHLNLRTGWWDASFVYGHNAEQIARARTGKGGRLRVDAKTGGVPISRDGLVPFGDQTNGWSGVTVLMDIFMREHNAIADRLHAAYPHLSDQELYDKARLVTAAVAAKIHTVDWTVELLKTRALYTAMNANWYGLLGLGPLGLGLVGRKKARNHGVKYGLTEEFTAVYRLHPLLPDFLPLDGAEAADLKELVAEQGNKQVAQHGVSTFLKSCMRYPCGSLELFNYPKFMRDLQPTDVSGATQPDPMDLAAVEIYRDRERGIQRYNDFRRLLNMNPMKDWQDLTGGHKETMDALSDVYGPDGIEQCDLLVGVLAEKKIPGFAISETAFHIFILMASRRLEADRFLTEHFNAETYSEEGFEWVQSVKGMRDLIARHYPDLEQELPPKASAFTPYEAMPKYPAQP